MRLSVIIAGFVMLAGCSSGSEPTQPQAAPGAEMVECALGEGSKFGPDCLVERSVSESKTMLVVRHPDGGFRRFEQTTDGRGLVELDGADEVLRKLEGDVLEVQIGADRYRFRARVNQSGQAAGAPAR